MNKTKPSADQPDIPHNEPSGGSASGTSPRKESKTAVGQNPVGAAGSEEPIDLDLSKQTLTVDFFKGAGIRDGKNDDLLQTLGELAEDMVGLYRMVSNLEGKITQVIATVSSLQAAQESLSRSVGMELERFKENLVSDRKEFIGRSTFNALIPAMESLKSMKRHYSGSENEKEFLKNTDSILDLLTGITQALRYTPFEVQPGADFDPLTMECLGYGEGDEGKVIRVEQSGYRAGQVLVRPCRVIIGKTRPVSDRDKNRSHKDSAAHTSQGAKS